MGKKHGDWTGSSDLNKGAGVSGQKDPAAEMLPALCGLQEKEIAGRRNDEGGTLFVPSDYHYFNYENFLYDLRSTASVRRKAQEYIRRENPEIRVSLRYNEGWPTGKCVFCSVGNTF